MKPIHIFWTICAVMFMVVFIVTGCGSDDAYWAEVSKELNHIHTR